MKKLLSILNSISLKLTKKIFPVHVFAFPERIIMDASNKCNLRCVLCQTGQNNQEISRGFLKFKDFKKFIDKYPIHLKQLLLSNWGDIFLNPEICKIIKYAKDKDIMVFADTSLNYFNKKIAEEIVISKMNHLVVSIDGATNKTYKTYRVGGDLYKVISNIKWINKYKKKYNSEYPKLIWKFILFGHNKHEINKAKSMAKKLNMEFKLAQNWSGNYSPVLTTELRLLKEDIHQHPKNFCIQLWDFPVINYNGDLLGCCCNIQDRYNFGNVFKEGFLRAFNSKKIKNARKIILKKKVNSYLSPCMNCYHRKNFCKGLSLG